VIRALALLLFLLPALASQAQETCQSMDPQTAVNRAGELTTLLQIANFRADAIYMGDVAAELEGFLATCGDEAVGRIAQVCGVDCHLQLGRYRLFLAAELPFLSSASGVTRNDSPLSPQAAQEMGRLGIEVVDRGLRVLARQQGGGGDDGGEASYRTFVRDLVSLSALKAQLQMNTGDIWYQTVSEARLKQLDFMIAETLEAAPSAGVDSQPNLSKASTNYEAALWVLVETQMDVPGEATYDDLRADLDLLETDLTRRMQSLRKGHLFLDIDPMQFTTIPFEQLQQRLAETRQELDVIEGRVEAILERWHAGKAGEATRVLDEGRTIRGQQVNLAAHRIGKLEHEAGVFANEVQAQVNNIGAQVDTFTYRQQIRSLEIALSTRLAEFENQRRQLQQRSELDLLVLSKEAAAERRNELRWLISWEMTRMNLDLQVSSLESQISEYDRQTARNSNQIEQLGRQRAIIATQIATAENGIAEAEAAIAEIEARRTLVFALTRRVAREDICAIESQLAFIGEPIAAPFVPSLPAEAACAVPAPAFTRTTYVGQMCGTGGQPGLRQKLLNAQSEARAFIMKCVVGSADFADLQAIIPGSDLIDAGIDLPTELAGVDCGNFTQTETAFARDLYEAEQASLEEQVASYAETAGQIDSQITSVIAWAAGFNGTVIAAQTGLTIAETVLATASMVPETTVAAAGLASGVYTSIKIDKSALNTVNALRTILSTIISVGQVTQSTMAQVDALNRQLTQIAQANRQLDRQKAIKAIALQNTHFKLAGQLASGRDELRQLALQSSLAAVDCEREALSIDEQVARLRADHARNLASLDLRASENDLLSFQIASRQRAIERHRNDIAVLGLELDKVGLNEAQLADDNARIARLVDETRSRITRVDQARATVEGLASQSDAQTNIIAELHDRQQAQMLALTDAELGFVESRIQGETANTEALVAGLEEATGLALKNRELQGQIIEFQGSILAEVGAEQEKLTDLVSRIDDPAERRNLFIANQETLSQLMKGIPDYLTAKRRAIEQANQLLHLMRRRFVVVNAVTGTETKVPQVYVTNATQLSALIEDIVQERFFDERQINIDVAQIVIPANSGFARRLALTEAVDFEISPFASTEALMRENGYFALWSPKFAHRRNLTLIDTFVGTQYRCTGAQWNRFALAHRGSGFVFRPVAEGSREVSADLLVGPERLALQTFFNLADSQAEVNSVIRYWLQDRFQVRSFPRPQGPPNDSQSTLPYLGAPVAAAYRLSLMPSDCPFDGAVFTLYVIFASAP
jgi:hypothetical protein